jgi:hypothetical protein
MDSKFLNISDLNGEEIVIIKESLQDVPVFSCYKSLTNTWKLLKDDGKYDHNLAMYIISKNEEQSRNECVKPHMKRACLCVYKNELRFIRLGRQILNTIKDSIYEYDRFVILNVNIILRRINSQYNPLPDYNSSRIEKLTDGFLSDVGVQELYRGTYIENGELTDLFFPYQNYYDDSEFLDILHDNYDLNFSDIIIEQRNKIIDEILM